MSGGMTAESGNSVYDSNENKSNVDKTNNEDGNSNIEERYNKVTYKINYYQKYINKILLIGHSCV